MGERRLLENISYYDVDMGSGYPAEKIEYHF